MNSVVSNSVEYTFNEDTETDVVKLFINLNEHPQQLLDCASRSGFYRDQIGFFTMEPNEGDEFEVTIAVIIHMGINPGYDAAAVSLLGPDLWNLFAEVEDEDGDFNDALALRDNYELTNPDAEAIVNRLMLNSSFYA